MHTVTIKSKRLAADVTAQQCRSTYKYRKHEIVEWKKWAGTILLFIGIKPQNGKHKNTRSIIGKTYRLPKI